VSYSIYTDFLRGRPYHTITAPQTPRWRPPAAGDCAGQPLIGTRRAALRGPCARARAPRRDAPSAVGSDVSLQRRGDPASARFFAGTRQIAPPTI